MDLPELHYLSASLSLDETSCAKRALETLAWDEHKEQAVFDFASKIAGNVRKKKQKLGTLDSLLQRYPINTDQGTALMTLAESLLRVPDREKTYELLKDRLGSYEWDHDTSKSRSNMIKAADIGLALSRAALNSPASALTLPAIHHSTKILIQKLGKEFVLSETIDKAAKSAAAFEEKDYTLSYDMLGEAARCHDDAAAYFEAYKNALHALDTSENAVKPLLKKSGISVKISALHPRYESTQSHYCAPLLKQRLLELCSIAADINVPLTIDAEESERLVLSLELFDALLSHDVTKSWQGLGLAVQAYQKRALDVIQWLNKRCQALERKIQVRLVKGAYWDREIKHAQTQGIQAFPVFTRKRHTDLNYLACAYKLLTQSDHIYPMFATHNAHTIATIYHMAKDVRAPYEFQRLFGMGDSVYNGLLSLDPDARIRIYAPVGRYHDLLAYLVRRMLENGANSSFVNQLLNPDISLEKLLSDPVSSSQEILFSPHPKIKLAKDLYKEEFPVGRKNSKGIELNDEAMRSALEQTLAPHMRDSYIDNGYSIIAGKNYKKGDSYNQYSPNDRSLYNGRVWLADEKLVDKAVTSAHSAFENWSKTNSAQRRKILRSYADLLENHSAKLYALLIREAGKTYADAQAEIREAIDFCRYYANQLLYVCPQDPQKLSGPTGEDNIYQRHGRGVFACISPWNFPLAIFTGQIAAALAAGNCVVAKPAEQTPLIATFAVYLWIKAGLPKGVLNLLIGDGFTGELLTNHEKISGVAFTGSGEVARSINQSLALKQGPITPFIAETGGLNAMIIDSSALLEQVVDDVCHSAFGSAGQRCSALRIAIVQDDIADSFIRLLKGKMETLNVGDPALMSTDIGPIIDEEARARLAEHARAMDSMALPIVQTPLDTNLTQDGIYFTPRAYEILSLHSCEKEVFGPILHVLRYTHKNLNEILTHLNDLGYGLTLGVHSRIPSFSDKITQRVRAGNVYINRTMTGAIVGSQPFGGHGLSGTGPKAGGPDYLQRFMVERSISNNTSAAGGNASLLSLQEDR